MQGRIIGTIILWLIPFLLLGGGYSITGYVSDKNTGETLIGAVVYDRVSGNAVATNVYGFYSLSVPKDSMQVQVSFVGYESLEFKAKLSGNISRNFQLSPVNHVLKEVVVEATKDGRDVQTSYNSNGVIKLPIKDISSAPAIGGEVDLIKAMQLMPGVKRGDEGQTGMFVRGGDGDQNLVLLDEATVYNVAHLFGFFSVFNTDALKDVTLIKGGFPAQYGGRLSSVLDIRMKDGNMNKFSGDGGIGLLSSRLTLQGPIIKDTMSYILSFRRSYVDQVFRGLHAANKKIPLLPYYFYDVNFKWNYKLSDKDRFFVSMYAGDDVLKFKADLNNNLFNFNFILGNFTATGRWNHIFTEKLFSNFTVIHSRFRYDVNGHFVDNSVFIGSSIRDYGLKCDFDYYYKPDHKIKFGGTFTDHFFQPNVISTTGEISQAYKSNPGERLNTHEFSLYGLSDYKLNESWSFNTGVRLSGALTQKKPYIGFEPRFGTIYQLSKNNSFNASYSRMFQYMHLVSSSSIALPTDLWYPVTPGVKPQFSDQVSLGYIHKFDSLKSFLSVEGYYKMLNNLIEYREGAILILNDNYEAELVKGKGWAYGVETFYSKTSGRFTYNLGYTLSWSIRQFSELNGGRPYYAKYDRRHDISFVGKYDLTKRLSFSASFLFATGSRITPIIGQYVMPNSSLTNIDILPIFASKNSVVLPPSHRLDINFIIKSRPGKRWNSEWHIGAYNVYNQTQPYRVKIAFVGANSYKYQAVGLFGFIPSLGYNFKF